MLKGLTDRELQQLLSRIASGDQAAFAQLFTSRSRKVYEYAQTILHNGQLAQDVVQEVFLQLWTKREQLPSVTNLDGYIYHAARNQTLNLLKKIAKETAARESAAVELKLSSESREDAEDEMIKVNHQLQLAIDKLPERQRKAFDLCQVNGMKYEEAAKHMEISPITVKAHLMKARKSLRKHLGIKFEEHPGKGIGISLKLGMIALLALFL